LSKQGDKDIIGDHTLTRYNDQIIVYNWVQTSTYMSVLHD